MPPSIEVDVKSDFDRLPLHLRMFAKDLPYAASQALNGTAFAAQRHLRQEVLPGTFELRNRRTQSGIRVEKSSKSRLVAEVGSTDWYIVEHVIGEQRRAIEHPAVEWKGQTYLGVPTRHSGLLGSRVIPKALRAVSLIRSGKGFVVEAKSGKVLLCVRDGEDLRVMYVLVPQTAYKGRLDLDGEVGKVVKDRFAPLLRAELERIATRGGALNK
jgi:hypothetical protein